MGEVVNVKKNIGILTLHYGLNYGAVLQAYALRKVLNSFSECHAELINYVPEERACQFFSANNIANMQKKREKFNKFLSIYCGVCTPMTHSVIGNAYDAYLVGSDMIWNTDFLEVTADYAYFLPDLNSNAKKVAYSASVGIPFEKIDKALFQKYLSKFHAISLREKSYMKFISELAGRECEYTLDPTMLLESSSYEALMKDVDNAEKFDAAEKPYILCFWYDRGDGSFVGIETANALARKYGLSIKHTFSDEAFVARQMLIRDNGCMFQVGISEFLWYVKHASVVVTNSFHGAIFSILFKRPLYICYQDPWKCRQENLVELFHLEDRVVQGYLSPSRLNLEMDYRPVFDILKREKERSIAYLKNALGLEMTEKK